MATKVYNWCMTRTNIDIDDEACAAVMKRYRLSTKREAVNFALHRLADGPTLQEVRALYSAGREGAPDEIQRARASRESAAQEDFTYRRATIEETRRMRGDTDLDSPPTREEWLSRPLVPVRRPTREEVLALEGIGWEGNLEEMRGHDPALEAWLNRPDDEPLRGLQPESSVAVDDDSNGRAGNI